MWTRLQIGNRRLVKLNDICTHTDNNNLFRLDLISMIQTFRPMIKKSIIRACIIYRYYFGNTMLMTQQVKASETDRFRNKEEALPYTVWPVGIINGLKVFRCYNCKTTKLSVLLWSLKLLDRQKQKYTFLTFLWSGIKRLPTIVPWWQVGSTTPRLVPHVKVPEM